MAEPFARKGQLLRAHLVGSCTLAKKIFTFQKPWLLLPHQELILKMVQEHDTGKNTSFFQDKLEGKRKDNLTNHSFLGGICFWAAQEKSIESFLCSHAIMRHHTSLDILKSFWEKNVYLESQEDILKKQLEDLLGREILVFLSREMVNDICNNLGRINHSLKQYVQAVLKEKSARNFFFLQGVYSVLLQADRKDSADWQKEIKFCSFPPAGIDAYLESVYGKNVDALKNQARQESLQVLKGMSKEEIQNTYFYTLTAPTGLGKTLISIQAALYLREQLYNMFGTHSRIIYAVPFINIAEEVAEILKKVFGQELTLTYHYTAGKEKSLTEEEESIDQVYLEMLCWDRDIILTSFVQLFHSIVSDNSKQLLKFISVSNSIVILDEVQSVPDHLKGFVGAVMQKMAEYYGTRFILCTATQPRLMDFAEKVSGDNVNFVELLPDGKKYFPGVEQGLIKERTKMVPYLERKLTPEEFLKFFKERYNGGSAVVIVNTIDSSRKIYKLLDKEYPGKVVYLSTALTPKDRRETINFIQKNISQGIILVSTQAIEAGVNLDFDLGFRALAPWESLIQSAGRVNRFGKKPVCTVYVFELDDGSRFVYRPAVLDAVKKDLLEKKIIPEKDYFTMVEKHYNRLLHNTSLEDSISLWQCLLKVSHDQLNQKGVKGVFSGKFVSPFRLIEDEGKITVFIEKDDIASQAADFLAEIYNNKNMKEVQQKAKRLFGDLKFSSDDNITSYEMNVLKHLIFNRLHDYSVQTRDIDKSWKDFSERVGVSVFSGVKWIPPDEVSRFYDKKIGIVDVK